MILSLRANTCRFMIALLFSTVPFFIPEAGAQQSSKALAQQARAILERRCYTCHGQNGAAARGIFVLDRAALIASKTLIPGKTTSPLIQVVVAGKMPLSGNKLSYEEITMLRR